jgi:hypothetical protein
MLTRRSLAVSIGFVEVVKVDEVVEDVAKVVEIDIFLGT